MLAGRAARVDVDRHQSFGLVDHDVAAGAQLHGRREHGVELAFDPHPREQRLAVAILPYRAYIGGHQHLHEVAGFLVAGFTGDLDLVDFLVVEVAQRALDQRAFLVDQRRGLRIQGHVAHGFPHADQIFEVALDFGLGARGAGGAQDDAHALGHVEILHHFLQPRTILGTGDLAADAAAARGVGHQHGVAAGQREIGGERGALVAAFFLDDLHQHYLPALDDFLNLVLAARPEGALGHFLHDVVAADGLDDFFLGLLAIVLIVVRLFARRHGGLFGTIVSARLVMRRVGIPGMGGVFARMLGIVTVVMVMVVLAVIFAVLPVPMRVMGFRVERRRAGRLGRRFGHHGMERVGWRFAVMGVGMARIVMRVIVVMMIVVIVMAIMAQLGRLLIAMGVNMAFAVLMMIVLMVIMMVVFMRLLGMGRIGACSVDHGALHAIALAAAARIAVARTAAVGAVFAFFLGLAMGALIAR